VIERSIAVIDVGSNSGRVVVLRLGSEGHLEVVADGRAPLRLALDVQREGRLTASTIERTTAVLEDFGALAESAGATETVAVATAAVRESENGSELVQRVRESTGLKVRVLAGEDEARYAFAGAIHGLRAKSGLVADVGGGSLELTRFAERHATSSWTLPFGALRSSDVFLKSDPPRQEELDDLRQHMGDALTGSGVGVLGPDDRLVGTGGTIRNLAKIDRNTRTYPIPRLHGYALGRKRVREIVDRLASRPFSRRGSVRGLNRDRADSIVGGSVVVHSLMKAVSASQLIVSGQGLREGIALELMTGHHSSPERVRESSIRALGSRFARWDPRRATRRGLIGARLLDVLAPGSGAQAEERMAHAATVLDVGRSVDYYLRHDHAAEIVTEADLAGFTHRELALLAAVIRAAGDDGAPWQAYRPLLTADDRVTIVREGFILALADEIEHRLPPDQDDAASVRCEARGRAIALAAPIFDPWRREDLARRFHVAFGKRLVFGAYGGSEGEMTR